MNIPNLEVCMYVCIIVVLYKTSLEFLGSLLISTYGVLFTNIVHHLRRNKKKKKKLFTKSYNLCGKNSNDYFNS